MTLLVRAGPAALRTVCPRVAALACTGAQSRRIATHGYNHHASALSVLSSNINKKSDDYMENARQMEGAISRMRELHQKVEAGGSTKARDKHTARGKMLPREYEYGLTQRLSG